MAPVKDHDLWKRIDHAMQIHQINCRVWQFDPPHVRTQVPQQSDQEEIVRTGSRFVSPLVEPGRQELVHSAVDQSTAGKPIATASDLSADSTSTPAPSPSAPIESHRLTLRQSAPAIEATLNQLSRVADVVEKNVKPIGKGRAYGYAIN